MTFLHVEWGTWLREVLELAKATQQIGECGSHESGQAGFALQ